MRQKHVISADDTLRSRRTANQKTGVCELGGASPKRCRTFCSLGNTTLCNWKCSSSNYHPSFDIIER